MPLLPNSAGAFFGGKHVKKTKGTSTDFHAHSVQLLGVQPEGAHLLPSFEPCSAAAPKKGTDSLCPLQSHHQPQPGEGIALPKKGPRRSHLKFQIFISMFKRLSIIYEVLGKLKS